ncbi:MAG: tyrosine--tRNA ligase [Saprospirales bacterium]|nr:tyrosine--tRNA ligase [Saprospirales bacterium]
MNFIEELRWRGMLQDMTPGVEEHLQGKMCSGYIGFDPTAPGLTIGNFVQIMLLTLFQRSGHRPVVLMGGATGRIGDPSGKDQERQLKSYEELDANLERQRQGFYKFLNFEDGPNKAVMANNLDFYTGMDVLTFLRVVGKTLTVNYMLSKDSVQNRLDAGLSFTEFSYQLLQAYDYQCLYEQLNCTVQMGGSDQWGNITSGTEFIRRNLGGKAYAVTTPLLTKADGSKMGKSETGNIWLDPNLTSPFQFYQYWINTADADLPKLIRYFTLRPGEEVEALEAAHASDPQTLKRLLAEELTIRVHSEEACQLAQRISNILFGAQATKEALLSVAESDLVTVSQGTQLYPVPMDRIQSGISIVDLLTDATGILPSKGEVRRAVQNNAISVNKEKVSSPEFIVNTSSLLHGKYIMVENGRKNKYLIQVLS